MSETRPSQPPPIWRCSACGTPNPTARYITTCLGCGAPRGNPIRETAAAAPTTAPVSRAAATPTLGLRLLSLGTWSMAVVVGLAVLLMRWVGNDWWGTALLLLMPRWAFLVPLVVLAGVAARFRAYRQLTVLGLTTLVVVGPLMGLNLPVRRWMDVVPTGETVRLASFNLGTGFIDDSALVRWLDSREVDVICFQEGHESHRRTIQVLEGRGWIGNERGTIATRLSVVSELPTLPDESSDEGRYTARLDRSRLKTAGGREIIVASIHLPTLRPGLQRLFRGSPAGMSMHLDWWGREFSRVLSQLSQVSDVPVLIGGDFNMPADDQTMVTLRANYRFAFDEAGWGYGYTRPATLPWVRIDHLLTSPEWATLSCQTGPHLGSDHLPVVGEFRLPPEEGTATTPPAQR
ncbi:MAG: endonuclease/exonuclease/phosphatase family protein [Isosphaeraceae bacterium]